MNNTKKLVFIILFSILSIITSCYSFSSAQRISNVRCNCVIFRLDDIQGYGFEPGQIGAMNLFLAKNQTLSLGMIMDDINNDSKIIDSIREGVSRGLFELGIHGWKHVDYTTLSRSEQKTSLLRANEKIQELFGKTSDVFMPPGGTFNNATLDATAGAGMRIFAADLYDENKYQNGSNIFVSSEVHKSDSLVHIPATLNYKDLVGNSWQKVPIETILGNIADNIKLYGYSVIVFHPQQLMAYDNDGTIENRLNLSEINDLSTLIDSVVGKNLSTVTHAQLSRVGASGSSCTNEKNNSDKMPGDKWRVTGYFTPVETDYQGKTRVVTVDNNSKRAFFISFLNDVNVEGAGKSRIGDYIMTYDGGNNYYSSVKPLAANGNPLQIGDVATDKSVIRTNTKGITIPTLSAPWNTVIFTATDTGSSIIGNSIDIYTGEGKVAQDETIRITSSNNKVCY